VSTTGTTDVIDSNTGEVLSGTVISTVPAAPTTAIAVAKPAPVSDMDKFVKEADLPLLRVMEQMDTLDWKNLKPHQTAFLLMQKPFNVSGGGTMYLTFKQAILFATRAYELGVSPFSSEVWFDPNRGSVNLTLEGKRQVARNKGIDLGPPQFEDLSRTWAELPKVTPMVEDLKKQGFTKDIGVKCRMRVGDPKLGEHVEYICWLTEWAVVKSPVWMAKPLHMLQTRAVEKALSLAMGTGASDQID
jgi:hypothetical protein